MNAPPVTRFDDQLGVGAHEGSLHCQNRAVGEDSMCVSTQRLHGREQVIPAPAVQSSRVFSHLIQEFVHLKGGRQRFDQTGCFDGASRNAQSRLGGDEHVVPETALQVTFHFRQVVVGARPVVELRFGAVEEMKGEIENTAWNRAAIHQNVLLPQMPSSRANKQHSGARLQRIVLLCERVFVGECPFSSII